MTFSATQADDCEYLESQLNLFCRMCWGNNGSSINALDKHALDKDALDKDALDKDGQSLVTFEETLLCAKNSALKSKLRSKYVNLMIGELIFYFVTLNFDQGKVCVHASTDENFGVIYIIM